MRTRNVLSIAAVIVCLQPVACRSDRLDPERAKELVAAHIDEATWCSWTEPSRATDTKWAFVETDPIMKCAASLANAGLLDIGACVETGFGGCFKREVSAGKSYSASLDEEARGLRFRCGETKLVAVTSIITDGSKATIKYERDFVPNETLLTKVEACKLDKPASGRHQRERVAVRDDAGNWSLAKVR